MATDAPIPIAVCETGSWWSWCARRPWMVHNPSNPCRLVANNFELSGRGSPSGKWQDGSVVATSGFDSPYMRKLPCLFWTPSGAGFNPAQVKPSRVKWTAAWPGPGEWTAKRRTSVLSKKKKQLWASQNSHGLSRHCPERFRSGILLWSISELGRRTNCKPYTALTETFEISLVYQNLILWSILIFKYYKKYLYIVYFT